MENNFRQCFHLEPQKGWLNDPNGLCFFNGKYHVYFQYTPEKASGAGNRHWGHFQSSDLTNWQFTGSVLFPDTAYDANGVFSRSGIVNSDTLYLFYTGNVEQEGDYDYTTAGRQGNTILVTTKDGVNMSSKKLLLENSDYPSYCSCHVRDPKVYKQAEKYHMVLGARTLQDQGCVLFYTSNDLENWEYEKTVFSNDGSYMWECPDVFSLGGNTFLSVSPQGLDHGEFENQNVCSSGYFKFGGEIKDFHQWDYGFDFYASQTFEDPKGRRIMIGWMGIGDIPYFNATTELGWQHCLTLPSELSVDDNGNIKRYPVKEIESLRAEKYKFDEHCCKCSLPFDLNATAASDSFEIDFFGLVTMLYEGGVFTLRFVDDKAACGRDVRKLKIANCDEVRALADKSSLEIFLNGGEKVMSSRFYPQNTDVILSVKGLECELWRVKYMNVDYLKK